MLRGIIFLFCLYIFPVQAIVLEDLINEGQLDTTLSNKKIGYYIGSFDPLHRGHEGVVELILKDHLCDYVLIYPAWGGDEYKNRTDVNIRLEMLFAVFEKHPKVIVTRMAPGKLQQALTEDDQDYKISGKPAVKSRISDVEYVGVIGSDTALETVKDQKKLAVFMKGVKIPEKYQENTIGGVIALSATRFIVSLRKGDSLQELEGTIGNRPIIKLIETKYPDVSSTKIRKLLQDGEPIDNLVSPGVSEIITKYDLYKSS